MSYIIRNQSVTQQKLAIRTTGPSVGVGGIAVSSSSGGYSSASSTFNQPTNLSVTLVTAGNPVIIFLTADGSTSPSFIGGAGFPQVQIKRNGTAIYLNDQISASGASNIGMPPGIIQAFDTPSAGSNVYSLLIRSPGGTQNAQCEFCILIAREL